ncbi:MAG: type II toxin-antitoxin system RelE/ParE family toxin [Erythrobacter sp.]|jgi:toxin ParE1/3/4
MNYRISDEAKRDLAGIGRRIAQDNPARALSFVDEFTAKFRIVAGRPLSFPSREEWHPDLRSALHRPYVILFRVAYDHVEIVRIFHGARDIPNLL